MRVGLFFGSFNPIHQGHLILASAIHEALGMDQIWFVVSPQNPFKDNKELLSENQRIKMVNLAIESDERFTASDIEFALPKPSYTIDTLKAFKELHDHDFYLIMGSDNLEHFDKWKDYKQLIALLEKIIVYKRPGYPSENLALNPSINQNMIVLEECPLLDISATYIRKLIATNKEIRYLCPDQVVQHIIKNQLYFKQ
jgi:nicotinate-nucleotide adenylyltransferase